MSSKQTEWSRAYVEKTYDRIAVTVPKGRKADIEAFIANSPDFKSINGLINVLLREKIEMSADEWKTGKNKAPSN